MTIETREARAKRRERMALSLVSLLILFGLLGGYVLLHATQQQEGKLGLISTSQVTIGVNEAPPTQSTGSTAASAPTATTTASKPSVSGQPGLLTEVFSSADEPSGNQSASASRSATGGSTSSGGQNGSTTAALPTPTSRPGSGPSIGIVPSGSGGTGGIGSLPNPTATSFAVNPTFAPAATSTSAPQATPGPSSTPASGGSNPTPVPTNAPPAATATPVPETVDEPGHHSHLHIDGFVGPGAYKAGGIIVSNLGTVAFDYSVSMTVSGDAAFASALRLRIYLRVGTSCDYPGQPPSPATDLLALAGDQVNTVLYDGTFTTGNKIGNPAAFPAAGDRHLNPGQSEVLCMEVFFPWGSGNEFQGLGVNGTQTFTAKAPDQ